MSETKKVTVASLSRLRSVLSLIKQTKQGIIGALIVSMFLFAAIVVEISNLIDIQITPYNPIQLDIGPALSPPSLKYLFGTDLLGRDDFSRIIAATPNDIAVSLTVVAVALLLGLTIGSIAAFRGGLIDEALMRFTDVIFALPSLVIAIVIAVILGPGIVHMMFALMIVWWPPYARVARGEALNVRHQSYIEAAHFSGVGTWKMLAKHVIPNIFTAMLVYATLDTGTVILSYAGLSYLGLSVRPPYPDWGEMVSQYQSYLLTAPWMPLAPGFTILVLVVGFSLLGDGIREALELA